MAPFLRMSRREERDVKLEMKANGVLFHSSIEVNVR